MLAARPRALRSSPQSANATSVFSTTQHQRLSRRGINIVRDKPLFDKILIANRGEIAIRVMKTARKMGIKTVAVYSEPDAGSLHVKMADEAVLVGPALSSHSYLNVDNIMQAIKKTGAQAVHPGYGFLSENYRFVERLEKEGVTFIGPSAQAMFALGDKIESKKLATKAKVNVIPGRLTEAEDVATVLQIAKEIGYPIMIKASAGGGGKGMRVAWNDAEAEEGFRLAKQEAKSSFGDDRLLIEKFIDNPRHIEVQIMGDGQGTTLYLNERECSIQRRNQKVLEEAPSSFIDPTTRKAMGEQAVSLANAVNYKSAGTCEFLVDSQRNFYFLEMNTRLQVEHPVTEYITGLDLVELMIRVAAGQKLPIKQSDVGIKGWSIESRVYAEDPLRNFLPSIGNLSRYVEPSDKEGNVRVDSGVREGDDIQVHYDPLISKLVSYGKTRNDAINAMAKALDEYVIRGVNHNVCFLRTLMNHPRWISGDISTKFIPEEYPKGFKGHVLNVQEQQQLLATAAVMHLARAERDATISGQLPHYKAPESLELSLNFHDQEYDVSVSGHYSTGDFTVSITDTKTQQTTTHQVDSQWPVDSFVFRANIDGKPVILQLFNTTPTGYRIQHIGTQYEVQVRSKLQKQLSSFMPVKKVLDTTKFLVSPMPGRVTTISVKEGDKVVVGQEVCVVEAMKMQNILRAGRDCKVKKVNCQPGDIVQLDALLVEFD